ncbi:hypothetical protein ACFFX0_15125 [Citricoccus parietis]|uniref:Uncharacterized protein n=1 Tax=Citricoccus parietis TaxID=592307 RepID=A0ABV5G0K7_9MICC
MRPGAPGRAGAVRTGRGSATAPGGCAAVGRCGVHRGPGPAGRSTLRGGVPAGLGDGHPVPSGLYTASARATSAWGVRGP